MFALDLVEASTTVTAWIANRADAADGGALHAVRMSYVFADIDPEVSETPWIESSPSMVTVVYPGRDESFRVPPATDSTRRPAPDLVRSHQGFIDHTRDLGRYDETDTHQADLVRSHQADAAETAHRIAEEESYCRKHDLFHCWLNH